MKVKTLKLPPDLITSQINMIVNDYFFTSNKNYNFLHVKSRMLENRKFDTFWENRQVR
jgi:hypothetical protein